MGKISIFDHFRPIGRRGTSREGWFFYVDLNLAKYFPEFGDDPKLSVSVKYNTNEMNHCRNKRINSVIVLSNQFVFLDFIIFTFSYGYFLSKYIFICTAGFNYFTRVKYLLYIYLTLLIIMLIID